MLFSLSRDGSCEVYRLLKRSVGERKSEVKIERERERRVGREERKPSKQSWDRVVMETAESKTSHGKEMLF